MEYSSDLSYHDAPTVAASRILMVPISDLEIHPSASEAKVLTDALVEGEESSSSLSEE